MQTNGQPNYVPACLSSLLWLPAAFASPAIAFSVWERVPVGGRLPPITEALSRELLRNWGISVLIYAVTCLLVVIVLRFRYRESLHQFYGALPMAILRSSSLLLPIALLNLLFLVFGSELLIMSAYLTLGASVAILGVIVWILPFVSVRSLWLNVGLAIGKAQAESGSKTSPERERTTS